VIDEEPPNAREWKRIRSLCHLGKECRMPFCRCEVEVTTGEDALRTAGALEKGRRQ
jgi:hypothetical protein